MDQAQPPATTQVPVMVKPLDKFKIGMNLSMFKISFHQYGRRVKGNSSFHFNLSHSTPTRIPDRRQSSRPDFRTFTSESEALSPNRVSSFSF